jgi:hypothetical protein
MRQPPEELPQSQIEQESQVEFPAEFDPTRALFLRTPLAVHLAAT